MCISMFTGATELYFVPAIRQFFHHFQNQHSMPRPYLFLILCRRREWCDNIQCLHKNMSDPRGRNRGREKARDRRTKRANANKVQSNMCVHTHWRSSSRIGSFSSIYMIYCYSCAFWCLKKQNLMSRHFGGAERERFECAFFRSFFSSFCDVIRYSHWRISV